MGAEKKTVREILSGIIPVRYFASRGSGRESCHQTGRAKLAPGSARAEPGPVQDVVLRNRCREEVFFWCCPGMNDFGPGVVLALYIADLSFDRCISTRDLAGWNP